MKNVAVIGTVGVPAEYGGFETLVENLVSRKHTEDIRYTVYCSAKHYGQRPASYRGARLKYLPLNANGIQSIPYDILSMLKASGCDVLLVLGCSGCIFLPVFRLFSKKRVVVNIDGLEHRRDKWNRLAKWFLRCSEAMAVRYADVIVADNQGIADYVLETYGKEACLIEYGGDNAVAGTDDASLGGSYGLTRGDYAFKVARIEPENNIAMVLEAFAKLPDRKLVVVGNWENSEYGREVRRRYGACPNIMMLDPIYEPAKLNLLRSNCGVYVHGHSAGGTNPSLVEAMCLGLPVVAFDVVYNRSTTENESLYFSNAQELAEVLQSVGRERLAEIGTRMAEIARRRYRWELICRKYESLFR